MGETLLDLVIEPQRAAAVPCFASVREAALDAGAMAGSLSGSGPSIFALCRTPQAQNLATVMEQACRGEGIDCQSWVSRMDAPGAALESAE